MLDAGSNRHETTDSPPNDMSDLRPPAIGLEAFAPQLGVEQLTAIYNPASIDAQRALGRFAAVKALGIEVNELHTVAGGAKPNAEHLARHTGLLGSRTLLAIIGGDGTANTVENALVQAGVYEPDIADTKRLFINGGTACDTAKALNRPSHLANIGFMLKFGWLQDMYPMDATLRVPNEDSMHIRALSYLSLGDFTGRAAEYINSPKHRERRLNQHRITKRLGQGLSGVSALRDAGQIDIAIDDEPTHRTLDIHCLSGPIMATLKHGSTELTVPGYHIVENVKPAFMSLLWRAIRLGSGSLIDKDQPPIMATRIETHDAAIFQADGETWHVPRGTTLDIRVAKPIQTLTTRHELKTK